jgi:serine acetyltransferase
MSLTLGGAGQFIGEALPLISDRVGADCKIFGIRVNIGIQSFQ